MISFVLKGLWESLYMTVLGVIFSYIVGLPVGLLLAITAPKGIRPNKGIQSFFSSLVNVLRSVPFIILIVALIPFTRFIVGTSIGSLATVVPLVVANAPLVARSVESSVQGVSAGKIEAAVSMGATIPQIITKVLLPEALPELVSGAAGAIISILACSAMAGAVGGGGLGAIAINYGYHRGQTGIMWVMILIIVLLVQGIQRVGTMLSLKLDHRIRERETNS